MLDHLANRNDLPVENAQTARNREFEERGNFQINYLKGWRLQVLTFAMCLGLFLAILETTIVSTSLVSITDDLNGFRMGSWVVAVYLVTYTGFLVVVAKLSDTLGRKSTMVFCVVLFIIFSLGCGFSRTMVQLIACRAFQGIGGGGISTLTFVILPENISPTVYPTYAAIVSSTFALSSLLGPLLGGIICNNTSWRWVFFLNAPTGLVVLALVIVTVPGRPPSDESTLSKLNRVDFLGAFLMLSSAILSVTALEQGGTGYSWTSAVVLAPLIVAIVLGSACLCWSWYLNRRTMSQEPMLPWNLLTDRFAAGIFLSSFFTGSVFLSSIVVLPQQFQVVFQDSPAKSGYRLLCMTLVSPLFAGVAGFFMQKKQIPPLYLLIAGQILAILGCGLASSIPETARSYPVSQYAYQAIMGAGFGLGLATAIMAAPLAYSKRNMAVGIGLTYQTRSLGESIGVSACANILSHTLTDSLQGRLTPQQISVLLGDAGMVKSIPTGLQEAVRRDFAHSFTRQMQALCGLAGAGLLATLTMVERRPRYQHREDVANSTS
ncbi:major facilitator superfamily transporter [Polyplosphaeria fusca]|uniref:Major facilitator superfamily transporter n=1 Tax=Polyplosphaeria fusca TaxID=682080 RepID=A0A9P4UZU7_9PLEO|nr:major facilitator superfamily transporter [Polyplosphaeria fusca]